jgi:hypothetical protein
MNHDLTHLILMARWVAHSIVINIEAQGGPNLKFRKRRDQFLLLPLVKSVVIS